MATKPRRSPIASAAASAVAGAILACAVACGGRVDLVDDCSQAAVTYCQANGCPQQGPASSAPAALATWCAANPSLAKRVTGSGTCATADGTTWAIDVRLSGSTGGILYLLYDPSSAQLVSVSTVGAGAGGGSGETDYGTCGANSGIVTCRGASFLCP